MEAKRIQKYEEQQIIYKLSNILIITNRRQVRWLDFLQRLEEVEIVGEYKD